MFCFILLLHSLVKEKTCLPTGAIIEAVYDKPSTSLVAQTIKLLPTMWETRFQSLGGKDPLEKEMATHSSILAWGIPWMEEPLRKKKKKISLPTSFCLRLANINIKHLKSIHFTFSFDSFYILRV